MEKKRELGAAEDSLPRVQVEIRTMFTNIFVAVYTRKVIVVNVHCTSSPLKELFRMLRVDVVAIPSLNSRISSKLVDFLATNGRSLLTKSSVTLIRWVMHFKHCWADLY